MQRTYILGLVAAILIGVSGGIYWRDKQDQPSSASYISSTTDSSSTELAKLQAQYDADSARINGFSSNTTPLKPGSGSDPSIVKPNPSPTQAEVCLEPEHQDVTNYPPDVSDKISAANLAATAKALVGTQTVTANFKINLGTAFNTSALNQYFTTLSVTASDAQIIDALYKLYNPAAASLADQIYGDLSNGTGVSNDTAYGIINGAFHRINDSFGGSGGSVGILKSSNTDATYSYNYGPSFKGYILSAKVTGSITATIGSVGLRLNAGYEWRDNCLQSLATGLSAFRGSASPFANLQISLTDPKTGKIMRDYNLNFGLGDINNHKLVFSAGFSKSF